MSKSKAESMNVAALGLFGAITVVLQILSYFIKIGTFNLSLVLIPIVLSAVLYGPKFGAVIGGVFGVVTIVASVMGVDAGGNILFNASPVITILICLIKGVAAGFVAGLIANALKEKHCYIAVILAAVSAPIVNTGLFVIAMFLFFKDTLTAWAGGTNLLYYTIFGLLGINFVIEFLINAVFSPSIYRVVKGVKKI